MELKRNEGRVMTHRIGVVQMVSTSDVEENLNHLEHFFIEARELGVELLALPENFAFMGAFESDKLRIAEHAGDGPIQKAVAQMAKQYKMCVIAGTIALKTKGQRIRASSLVYDNLGHVMARYDKIHLFDVCVSDTESYKESDWIEPGTKPVVVDTPVGRIGLSVCYDLRFAELYQLYLKEGVQILSVPSAFTAQTGKAHWQALLKARAIENLSYVIAPNQGGLHASGRQTYGHSMIVEPWGEINGIIKDGSGMVVSDIDLDKQLRIREQFPCHTHHIL